MLSFVKLNFLLLKIIHSKLKLLEEFLLSKIFFKNKIRLLLLASEIIHSLDFSFD